MPHSRKASNSSLMNRGSSQRRAFPCGASGHPTPHVRILRNLPLDHFVFAPLDISIVVIFEQDGPFTPGHRHPIAFVRPRC